MTVNGTANDAICRHPNGDIGATTNGTVRNHVNGAKVNGDSHNLRKLADSTPEPIAICGIGLRLPGGIHSGEALWDVLYNGKDLRGPIPADRFNIEGFGNSLGNKAAIKTRYGYFLDEDLDVFDPSFTNMGREELEKTDPQQRKVLEVARECLENAGETNWRSRPIGVYVGTFGDDWLQSVTRESQFTGGYNLSGDLMIANRISYEFDLQGPSLAVKTGCSASLVALHEACRALQKGDCCAALVCGTSLLMGPHVFSVMTGEGILSAEGSCKTFDAAADGFARADGINAVFLKRLPDAIRDGNPIRAVIRNTGNNSDGRSQGLLSPRASAQEALMRHVYSQAHLDPADTGFIECHGTGTPTGDPIETSAIGNIFVLSLEHLIIPPNIKFLNPNPKIPFTEKNLVVPTVPTPWPKGRALRVSVNSFGIGGSNAHVIIESPAQFFTNNKLPQQLKTPPPFSLEAPRLLLFSGNTAESVKTMMEQCIDYNRQHPTRLNNLAFTLANKREKLSRRSYALAWPGLDKSSEAAPVVKAPTRKLPVIFCFSGQGSQWPEMGRELLKSHSVFSESILEMDRILKSLKSPPRWTLRDELMKQKQSTRVYEAELSQPLTTAVQLGLVNVLRQLGVKPEAVIGHSSGEIAAAYASGLLSMGQAIIISYLRGWATKFQTNNGSMAAIGLGADAIGSHLPEGVVIAAENSPSSVSISGDTEAVNHVVEKLKGSLPDILARRLQVDMAYHSTHMSIVGKKYLEAMKRELGAETLSLLPTCSGTTMFSTVTTQPVTQALDLTYWVINLTSEVKFSPAFSNMLASLESQPVCIEIGPHSQMSGPVRQISATHRLECTYIPVMKRFADCLESLLGAIGQLFQHNVDLNVSADKELFPPGETLVDMPLYPWNHSVKYWFENRVSHDFRFRKYGHHALLGERITESSALEPAWRCVLELEDEPWLKGHVVDKNIVFPFSGYVSMAGEAIRQISGIEQVGYKVKHIVVHTALVLAETKPVELVTTLRRRKLTDSSDSDYYDFVVSSFSGRTWTKHCEGSVTALHQRIKTDTNAKTLPRKVVASRWYEVMARVGLKYGDAFRGIQFLEASPSECRAIAGVTATASGPFLFHPATMDSAFQLVIVAGAKAAARNLTQLVVPTLIEEIDVFPMPDSMIAEAWACSDHNNVGLECTSGEDLVLRVKGARLTPLESDQDQDTDAHKAARMEFFPDVDFMDVAPLIRTPKVKRDSRIALESIVLLSILDSADRLEHLEPSQPHYHTYREWLRRERDRATNGGYPFTEIDAIRFAGLNRTERSDEIQSRLAEASQDPNVRLLASGIYKVNQNCEGLFTGQADALALLLEDNILTEIYNSVSFDFSQYVRLQCISKPKLRILEVGAGTGGATELILRDLVRSSNNPLYSIYTFTDISAGFFAQASERFSYAPNMEYKVFDISQSPSDQGFDPESYDIIIANNVVHATANLNVTLGNLQPLLRPGGQLLLSEVCATAAKAPGFVFGQFSGWWMGEADNRKWEPFVPVDRWDRELKAAGFTGVDTAVFDETEPYQYCAAMISHIAPKGLVATPNLRNITILCDNPETGLSFRLIEDLQSRGHGVNVAKFGALPLPPNDPILVTLDLEGYFFEEITAERLRTLQDICRQHQGQQLLWLMPQVQVGSVNPRHGQTIGALRIIREELSVPFHTLEMAQSEPSFTNLALKVLQKIVVADETGALDPDREFVVENGEVLIGRCQPMLLERSKPFAVAEDSVVKQLSIGKTGLLETLHWVATGPNELKGDEIEIDAKAVGLNFRDIMVSMGVLTFGDGTPQLGIEMSGIVTRTGSDVRHVRAGDRVIAVASEGCFSTRAIAKAPLVVQIPKRLSFEEAATMPTVFGTVLQALVKVARLRKGSSVLIHSACGGIGHAAIQVCKIAGAEIYVTTGSVAKANYAHEVLNIPRNRIFNSRDNSFLDALMRETHGKGVDIVLNSLSGNLLHASWECVAEFGQLIELGKRDLVGYGTIALEPFLKNRSYCCVDLAHMLECRPEEVGDLLREMVDLFSAGKIEPIQTRAVYDAREIEQAFRHMQKGDHIGKIVVRMPDNSVSLTAHAKPVATKFDPAASYLITGGLGGLGRSVATWMAERGARNLIFLSRSAGKGRNDSTFFAELAALNCAAIPVAGRVEVEEDVRRAIAAAPSPVKGVIHLAMVLRDGAALDLTFEDWTAAIAPKVQGAWNLHNAFIQRAEALDFFVAASSIATLAHHPGQINYAAANAALESMIQYRRASNLPAAVLGLCAADDAGFVADNPIIRRKLQAQGVHFLPEKQILDYFEFALSNQLDPVTSDEKQQGCIKRSVNHGYTIVGLHSEVPLDDPRCPTVWRRNRKMSMYHNIRATSSSAGSDSSNGLKVFLERASADGDPAQFLLNDANVSYLATEIGTRIFHFMMRDAADLDISASISAIGMDSLMAIELRRWWKQAFAVDVTVLEIMGAGTIMVLGRLAGEGIGKRLSGNS
ncbi:KR domain-containing protein [Xylaria arbuscula]|nr:KR domain-containing protein [Xylaria arbuscula]